MNTEYYVESIGASFSAGAIKRLGKLFQDRAQLGFELHSVFHVYHRGCLGFGAGYTYLAVYVRKHHPMKALSDGTHTPSHA